MIRTVKIYTASPITVRQLAEFLAEAEHIGAGLDDTVRVHQAPETGYQQDPGGEVTIEISVTT